MFMTFYWIRGQKGWNGKWNQLQEMAGDLGPSVGGVGLGIQNTDCTSSPFTSHHIYLYLGTGIYNCGGVLFQLEFFLYFFDKKDVI